MLDASARLNAALVGRYRVEAKIGEGGMATVYSAQDLRHDRKVALKVLEPEIAAVVGAARFLAEIRTTASLQHPHILPLFDSGEAEGLLFYVMPRVEGESLRERLDRERQLSVDEAVRIATQVGDALDHAHRQGVIHRDIKPANILLHEGKPLIADFGIALALHAEDAGRITETGLSLGTPHYMSPEQATGEHSLGVATDIWALGCVLYEMLMGEPPYTGGTAQAVLGKIITAAPPSVSQARSSVPPNVDAAIRKALEKVPADRFRTAGELTRALADPAFRHGAERAGAPQVRTSSSRVAVGFAAALAILMAAALLWSSDSDRADPRAAARFDVTPGDDQRLPLVPGVDFTLSPDGRRFVFVGSAESGVSQLWQRPIESLEAVRIPGTEDALHPTFSPDGASLAYQVDGEIRTIPLEGGPSVRIATGNTPAWGADGMIYFSRTDAIYRVPATGGEPVAFTAPEEGRQQRFPSVLPDGRGLVLSLLGAGPSPEETLIGVVGPDGGDVRALFVGAMARYAETGHLLYSTAGRALMAVPFDARRLEVTGTPVALLEDLVVKSGSASQFAVSVSGTVLYGVGGIGVSELVWVSRGGEVAPVDPAWTADFNFPSLSPDGRRAALSIRRPEATDIWIKQLDAGPALRLTLDGTRNDMATWTPDGEGVTFLSNQRGSSFDLWSKPSDGSGQASPLLDREWPIFEPLWSPDGQWLVYQTASGENADIMAIRADFSAPPSIVAGTDGRELAPTFSPDGDFIAYTSSESGLYEVYVVPFPDAGTGKWAVSTGGGSEPVWSRDGREIFHRTLSGDMVAVPVVTSPSFSMGTPRTLFSASAYRAHLNHRQYDVSPDGRRFLMLRALGGDRTQWIIALDFFNELETTSFSR